MAWSMLALDDCPKTAIIDTRVSPIMSADTEELRASRLTLAETTLRQLELTLDLLGIEAPERM